MRRLTGRGPVVLLALLGAAVVLVAGFRPWVSGTVADAVLGGSTVTATGADVAPGLSAIALAVAAAAVAAVAAGRVARLVALVLWAACLVGAAVLTARVLADPSGVLGPVAAARVGRTGSVEASATATVWPWLALLGAVVAGLGLAGALLGRRGWAGPSRRYEVPGAAEGHVEGARGERVGTAWDDLSAGRDPTDVGDDRPT